MKKVVIYVTETRRHKVVFESSADDVENLINELGGINANEIAGDMCDDRSFEDGDFEVEDYGVTSD